MNFTWTLQLFHRKRHYSRRQNPHISSGDYEILQNLSCIQYIVLRGFSWWSASHHICSIIQNQMGHQYHNIASVTHPRSFDGNLSPLREGLPWERPLAPNEAVAWPWWYLAFSYGDHQPYWVWTQWLPLDQLFPSQPGKCMMISFTPFRDEKTLFKTNCYIPVLTPTW